MRLKLYNFLVNKHSGIRTRYHYIHDRGGTWNRVLSWIYLMLLNFGYYVLSMRFLDTPKGIATYEEKGLLTDTSESAAAMSGHPSAVDYAKKLAEYDVISFDIFDTLILRPFSAPTDLFFFMDEPLGILDFHRIRMEMEARARGFHFEKHQNYEVTLAEIWELIEREAGIPAQTGMALEQALELEFCYANPFMAQVYEALRKQGKRIFITTDMYLPAQFIRGLLAKCGYSGYEQLLVSCEYGKSKGSGKLFDEVLKLAGRGKSVIHIGDNENSDVKQPRKSGLAATHYPNINKMALTYRAYDMSAMVGGAYRGIVANRLYSGEQQYSRAYEYGFICGGLFVTGFCGFIHNYCEQNKAEKVLFLARDGDILKRVYDFLYPGENTEYVYWSRMAAVKLMAEHNRYDYFRRFIWHKTGEGKTANQILRELELEPLGEKLKDGTWGIKADDIISAQNGERLKKFLLENWETVLACYDEEQAAAKMVFEDMLSGCKRAVTVDIGWAGSGGAALSYLVEREWKIPCEVSGIVAGTNTMHNAEPDTSEGFLQAGKMTAYLYSQAHNRDLLKKHDPNRDYNIYWELLLSSTEPSFLGYALDKGKPAPRFGRCDLNPEGIREIQKGIEDFAADYKLHFGRHREMFSISGRDAYAPMLLAAGKNEEYLKKIAADFKIEIGVKN